MPHSLARSPATAHAPAALRNRIAPPGAELMLIEIRDVHSGVDVISYVDVAAIPVPGQHVIVTDGIVATECVLRADVPVPDDLVILGRSCAIIIPR